MSLAAPPDAVWPWIADPTRFAEWRRGAGVTSGGPVDDGPIGVGSRFRLDVTTQGRSGSLECTVTAYDPNRRFAFASKDSSGFSGSADTRLEPEGAGSRLDFAFELQLPGGWRLMQPVISRALNQAADTDFATLQGKFAN
ncbi:MAG: SRPBCC family protein [Candidatus Limnocylindria bacterium]